MPYNPFAGYGITGTWESHASYSLGGTDIPLAIGTDLPAPAAGTLRISGGSGEFAAGYIGSAGRRSILELDHPIARVLPRKTSPSEGEGPMVAIVFQHQSRFGVPGHYDEGEDLGDSGDSDGTADGGDDHLHWHGLNAAGERLRVESFITSATAPAGGGSFNPVTGTTEGDEDMGFQIKRKDNGKTYQLDASRITHVVHDDVAKLMPYIGQGIYGHIVSKDDFRRIVEEQGWPYDRVAALAPGRALIRGLNSGGTVVFSEVNAGAAKWPATWS